MVGCDKWSLAYCNLQEFSNPISYTCTAVDKISTDTSVVWPLCDSLTSCTTCVAHESETDT